MHIRQNSSYWVKDLDLRTGDKDVILAESGMLSDRHMYAAHKLMRMQFPNIEGCMLLYSSGSEDVLSCSH